MWRYLVYVAVYAVSAFAALQLGRLQVGHSVCGPWGCGPPTEALLAIHTFWLVTALMGAIAVTDPLAPQKPARHVWTRAGLIIAVGSLLAVVAIGFYDFLTWRPDPFRLNGMYLWQRFLFRLVTITDFPVVQLGIGGALLAALGKRRLGCSESERGVPGDGMDRASTESGPQQN